MNGRNIEEALIADSFTLLDCGPTRGGSTLDLFYTNASPDDSSCESFPPLVTEGGIVSNHSCVKVGIEVPVTKDYVWVKKTTGKRTEEGNIGFAAELGEANWEDILSGSPDEMVEKFDDWIRQCTDKHFPLQTVRQRSNEDPWITKGIRQRAKRKKRLYRE